MKILATVHVFYPEFWPELAACLRNVSAPCDVVATLPEGSGFADAVRRDFPDARILFCENRGLMLLVASHDAAPGFEIARIEDLLGDGSPADGDGRP